MQTAIDAYHFLSLKGEVASLNSKHLTSALQRSKERRRLRIGTADMAMRGQL
jgi:hypothetical protein